MPPSTSPLPAILVTYATSTGTTREIAEHIASTLQTSTSWRVDCKSVSEIPSLHKELHCPPRPQRPAPAPAPTPAPAPATKAIEEEDHTIHINPLSALISREEQHAAAAQPAPAPTPTPTPAEIPPAEEDHTIHINPLSALISREEPHAEEVEYRAVIIGSSIHAGKWLCSGRKFLSNNRDFFAGRCCCAPTGTGTTTQALASVPKVKVYAFSVGMPPDEKAFIAERESIEAAMRKVLGKRTPLLGTGKEEGVEEEEEEILEKHVLFRGMWSPDRIEKLGVLPRILTRLLRVCLPRDSELLREDDQRDWMGIEGWAVGVGKEIIGDASS